MGTVEARHKQIYTFTFDLLPIIVWYHLRHDQNHVVNEASRILCRSLTAVSILNSEKFTKFGCLDTINLDDGTGLGTSIHIASSRHMTAEVVLEKAL